MRTSKAAGIGMRLGLAFAAMTALMVVCAVFGLSRLSALNATIESLLAHEAKASDATSNLIALAHKGAASLGRAVMADGIDGLQAGVKEAIAARKEAEELRKVLEAAVDDEVGRQALAAVAAAEPAYRASVDKVIAAIQGGDTDAARLTLNDKSMHKAEAAYLGAMQKLDDVEGNLLAGAPAHAAAAYAMARNLLLVVAAVGVAIAAALALWITRSIVRPANVAVSVAARIAEGDLSEDVPTHGQDEMGRILDAMQAMQRSLREVVGGVRSGSDSIATASHEIALGNQNLSQRTEEQAGALQETAASMEQLGTTVRQNADNARRADQLARSANEVARSGGAVVGEVVQTMKGINDSSRRIADIITVIDGIAFQTNILALNAAVEAARAGEQGRGFAVVAGEVRNLAQRSAEAAREIKSLITASVERVEQGTALVDRAGATMNEVVASIERVTAIVGEISAASDEQSSGVGQVGQAISQMDKATQQNAALVEQSAAAAESLSEQAKHLVDAVAVFRTGGERSQAPARTAAPAAVVPPPVAAPAPKAPVRVAAEARRAAPAPAPAPRETAEAAATDEWASF